MPAMQDCLLSGKVSVAKWEGCITAVTKRIAQMQTPAIGPKGKPFRVTISGFKYGSPDDLFWISEKEFVIPTWPDKWHLTIMEMVKVLNQHKHDKKLKLDTYREQGVYFLLESWGFWDSDLHKQFYTPIRMNAEAQAIIEIAMHLAGIGELS